MSFFSTLLALIYLSYNMSNGSMLVLSDGSRWDINPDDQKKTSLWMTPMEIQVKPSNNQTYPYMLVNMQTKENVLAKVATQAPMPDQPSDIVTDQGAQGTTSAPTTPNSTDQAAPNGTLTAPQAPTDMTTMPQAPNGTATTPPQGTMTMPGTTQGTTTSPGTIQAP
jgi:hypothetical protein